MVETKKQLEAKLAAVSAELLDARFKVEESARVLHQERVIWGRELNGAKSARQGLKTENGRLINKVETLTAAIHVLSAVKP